MLAKDQFCLCHVLDNRHAKGAACFTAAACDAFCLGASIFSESGEPFAACSISGTDKEIIGEKLELFSECIRYTAQEISRRMGYVPKGDTLIWKEIRNPLRKNM